MQMEVKCLRHSELEMFLPFALVVGCHLSKTISAVVFTGTSLHQVKSGHVGLWTTVLIVTRDITVDE